MKIGIHHRPEGFSQCWLDYCADEGIDTKLVDCYSSDIISQLSDCDALMWHFHHASSRDVLFAKQLMYSLQVSGKVVFPDFNTVWYFDDKVGQKYLLEAVDAPYVSSYVFYEKKRALKWAQSAAFPKVFKLRKGSSSANVKLIKERAEAVRYIKKAFGSGFPQYNPFSNLKERWRKYRNSQTDVWDVMKGVARFGHTTDFDRVAGREIGYVYFQDFIPDREFDLRVIVIDGKAFGVRRNNRKNDFRASGSGFIEYGKENFDDEIINLSFRLAEKMKSSMLVVDYVYDGKPLIVEINFGYKKSIYSPCSGFWDRELNWHEGSFNPQHWMVDLVVKKIEDKNSVRIQT